MAKVFIGTSGWVYEHWKKVFYPKDLKPQDKLKYFAKHFRTAEINYSFYHLPKASTYQNWYNLTPRDFIFAVKASRFITHIKRLKGVKAAWQIFLKNALNLEEKLGPILFQLPPSFKATEENIKRLDKFLRELQNTSLSVKTQLRNTIAMAAVLRIAVEFRHKSWCDERIYKLLRKYNVAWVIADSSRYPRVDKITANFVYIRMHGSKIMFSSKYTTKELKSLTQKIKKWQKQNLDVYCYFNNDAYGSAIENTKEVLKLL